MSSAELRLCESGLPVSSRLKSMPQTRAIKSNVTSYVAAAAIVSTILIFSAAAAVQAATLNGDASVTVLTTDGPTSIVASDFDAMRFWPELANATFATLVAETATVSWKHASGQSLLWGPDGESGLIGTGGGTDEGNVTHNDPSISIEGWDPNVNFLIVGDGATVNVTGAPATDVRPSPGEPWWAGPDARQPDSVSVGMPRTGEHPIRRGAPTASFQTANIVTIRGDFTLYTWSAITNLTLPNGTFESHRSGQWDENVQAPQAHPRGVAREDHAQYIWLQLAGAELTISGWEGAADIAAPILSTETDGDVVFDATQAYFESETHSFQTGNKTIRLAGLVHVSVEPMPEAPNELAAHVTATSVTTALTPSARLPLPTEQLLPETSSGPAHQAASNVNAPRSHDWQPWVWLATGALIGVPVLAYLARKVRQQRAQTGVTTNLRLAEAALVEGRPEEARAWTTKTLRAQPDHVDAWFIHGASLLQQKKYTRLVKDLEAPATRIAQAPGLAFLLCLAYVKLKKVAKARHWSQVAATDPDFRHQLEADPTFSVLADNPRSNGLSGPQTRVVAKGTVVSMDIAYG